MSAAKHNIYTDSLYKFSSASTLKLIIENESLRFSRADSFNDAFELSPFLVPLDWDEICEMAETNMKAAKFVANEAFMRICSSLFITCFSKSYLSDKSELMWAHYGDNHRGVAFEINCDVLNSSLGTNAYVPVCVNYTDSLQSERNARTPESDDLGMLIGATKSKNWEYEEEARVVLVKESLDADTYNNVEDNELVIDVKFDPKSITKVIFGVKSSVADVVELAKLFVDIGHIPRFIRLGIDPLSLQIVEKDTNLESFVNGRR